MDYDAFFIIVRDGLIELISGELITETQLRFKLAFGLDSLKITM